MAKFSEKWGMIKTILRNDDSILINYKNNNFEYLHVGDNLMFADLFLRLCTFIPNWRRQWNCKEAPVSKADIYLRDLKKTDGKEE